MYVLKMMHCVGLMLVGCGMMTTGVPTMITAGVTGTLPGASDYQSTSGQWAQDHASIGRVLLDDSGATAASGRCHACAKPLLTCLHIVLCFPPLLAMSDCTGLVSCRYWSPVSHDDSSLNTHASPS